MKKLLLISAAIMVLSSAAFASGNVAESAGEICPIKIGAEVPDVTLATIEGESFELLQEVKSQPSVLIFYRGSW